MTEERRPAFAKEFPRTPELDALVEQFDRGDYRSVREGTDKLTGSDDAAVRDAAKALRARTEPDPFAKVALLLTLVLLVWLTFYWERHDGKRNLEPDQPAPPPQAAPAK
jgi:hypothetical protein